jgi:FkbM family methyltransferase
VNETARRLFDGIAWVTARRPFYRLNRALFYVSGRGLGLFNSLDLRLSGEEAAIRGMSAGGGLRTVLDVGANEGHFTALVLEHHPDAVCHCFEPHPETFGRLERRFPSEGGPRLVHGAVGDAEGTTTLYDVREGGSQLASLVAAALPSDRRRAIAEVPLTTLDAYCAAQGIERVDLLKIDVEGHELAVLRGARRLFEEERVERVLFEFNEMNVAARSFLRDFRELLPGFVLHRLLVDGPVPLGAYAPFYWEQFAFQNILALRKPVGA